MVVAAYAAPVLAIGGVIRGVNNSKLDDEIKDRQTRLPITLDGREQYRAQIFYPVSPSPKQIEVTYHDSSGSHTLVLDTRGVLDGLHLEALPESALPAAAKPEPKPGTDSGTVKGKAAPGI